MSILEELDSKIFFQRLRAGAMASQMTLEELETVTDIPRTAIRQYIDGEFLPPAHHVVYLIDALRLSPSYLLEQDPLAPLQLLNVDAPLDEHQTDVLRAQAQIWLEMYRDIRALNNYEVRGVFLIDDEADLSRRLRGVPHHDAETVRASVGIKSGPIPSLIDVLEGQGIIIGVVNVRAAFEAATFATHEDISVPLIVFQDHLTAAQQRHALLRQFSYLLYTDASSNMAQEAFADSFLVPDADLRERHHNALSAQEVAQMAHEYGTTVDVVLRNYHYLKTINTEEMQALRSQLTVAEYVPEQIPHEDPVHLMQMVDDIMSYEGGEEILDQLTYVNWLA